MPFTPNPLPDLSGTGNGYGGLDPSKTVSYVGATQATQAEAETGTNNDKWMTPLRTAQAINALGSTDALPLAGGALDVDAEVTASITPDGNGRSVDTEFGGWGFGVEEKIDGTNTGTQATMEPEGFRAGSASGSGSTSSTHLSSTALTFDNGSSVKKGKADAGIGGNGGVALKCSLEYELKWDGGRLFVMQQDGTTIRRVEHCGIATPTFNDDSTKGFVVGSQWVLDDETVYVCTQSDQADADWRKVFQRNDSEFHVDLADAIGTSLTVAEDYFDFKTFNVGLTLDESGLAITCADGGDINLTSNGGLSGSINLSGGVSGSGGTGGNGGSIDLTGRSTDEGDGAAAPGGSIISRGGWEGGGGGTLDMSAGSFFASGGSITTRGGGENRHGGSINTSEGGGSIDTRGKGSIQFGEDNDDTGPQRTTVTGTATANRSISLPDASGTLALTNHTHPASAISDSTAVGRAVLTAASEASARAAIGAASTSDVGLNGVVQLTQAQFNALTAPNATTLYIIIG